MVLKKPARALIAGALAGVVLAVSSAQDVESEPEAPMPTLTVYRPVSRDRAEVDATSPPPPVPTPLTISGVASWYESWCNCTAMTDQRWRGKKVTVAGPAGTRVVRITDAGPVPSLKRVIDLNPDTFIAVCGPLHLGLCTVDVSLAE